MRRADQRAGSRDIATGLMVGPRASSEVLAGGAMPSITQSSSSADVPRQASR